MKIPVIIGPTGIGKTDLAIELSLAIGAEIVACDSRQIYIGMDIGTAKPSYHLQQIVRHHLIDLIYPDEKHNAQMWAEQAEIVIDAIRQRGIIPLIICGTGLYLAALTEGFFPLPEMSEKQSRRIAAKIKHIEEQKPLYEYLKHIDAESAERIHPNDEYRIRRAIEIFLLTGKPITHHRRQIHKKPKQGGYTFVGLTMERELLYMRIDQRVEEMVRRGFIEEVDHLLKLGYDRELGAFHAPGYNEFLKYFGGALTREEAIEETKKKTRNYAKRQFTWFRKIHEAKWFDVTEGYKSTVKEILALFRMDL